MLPHRRPFLRLLAGPVLATLCFLAQGATAQDVQPLATLIADSVQVNPDGTLRAEGSVEVLYQGRRIQADAVVYDRTTDQLTIEGPIRLSEGDGGAVLVGSQAELDSALRDGVLRSARLVLDRQVQIAASEIQRSQGRYTQLYRAVASSCEVCSESEVPLWQIRADRVIHDQLERQIYFQNATFEVAGIPVFYLPRFRVPDPTLERASGFLFPEFRSTNDLGFGVTVPYFFVIDDHSDLTISPSVTNRDSRTLGLRYREVFTNGNLVFEGYYTRDQLEEGDRGLATLDAAFALPRGFALVFDLETVSDRNYYRDYGFDDKDRIESSIRLSRTRRDQNLRLKGSYFTTFRSDEDNDTIPRYVLDGEWNHRFVPASLGGQAELSFEILNLQRPSDEDQIGRDTLRLSGIADWRRSWTSSNGIVATALGELAVDTYVIDQDSRFESTEIRTTPTIAGEVRWPLQKTTDSAQHILEPVAQLVWSRITDEIVPNEDSRAAEFDEVSLFDFNRFSGRDRLESGWRSNLGLIWTRRGNGGWDSTLHVGRVFREGDGDAFTPGDDARENASDWLTTYQLETPFGLRLINRAQYGTDFRIDKNTFRLGWAAGGSGVSMRYTWLRENLLEDRDDDTSELALGGFHQINRNWRANFAYTYDEENSRSREADLGLVYSNECITMNLSLSRDFASSASLRSTTDFGFKIALAGFGADGSRGRRANRCRL